MAEILIFYVGQKISWLIYEPIGVKLLTQLTYEENIGSHCALAATAATTAVRADRRAGGGEGGGAAAVGAVERAKVGRRRE